MSMEFKDTCVRSLANGINAVNATVWIIECAPAKHRGRMAALQEVFMATGSLLCQTVGVPFSNDHYWPYIFMPPVLIAIFTTVLFCFTWESPQYIVTTEHDLEKFVPYIVSDHCRVDYLKARNALAFYHGQECSSAAIDAELKLCEESSVIKKGTTGNKNHKKSDDDEMRVECEHDGITVMFNIFKATDPLSRVIRYGAWIGVMVKVAYVFTGARCLRAYSTFVLHYLGHWTLSAALYGSFAIGLLRVPFTLIPVLLVDNVGRRPLIVISMVISLITQIAIMFFIEMGDNGKIGVLLSLCTLLMVNACGLGSVSRFYSAELVPRYLLLNSVAILTIFEGIMKIAVEFTFYPIANIIGGPSMLLFAVPTTLFVVFVWYLCPETCGRHVAEILNEIAITQGLKVNLKLSV
ncbi:unnamed protein product [Anisakis simplex]|uniref:MFS domain-containing protein n=1 Tax=Anisakis simplex TaxID=6269 RepID=A0A0M3JU63_ANISI|nr:unnamed protein product [Anisakis simplex]